MKVLIILIMFLMIFGCNKKTPQEPVTDIPSEILEGTVTDIDGNVYKTVKIGDQVWMAENLKVTHYRSGEAIPNYEHYAYNYDNNNVATYGLLYTWDAVSDSRNIAPEGWHVPSDDEWQTLVDYLGGVVVAGGKMKATGTIEGGDGLWREPNEGAINESSFSALPGGVRANDHSLAGIGSMAFFWSSTENFDNDAWYRYLGCTASVIDRINTYRSCGLSVRCVQD